MPIWYVMGSRPIFFSSSSEMSSLKAVVFLGSKTLNCSTNSCRHRTTEKIQSRNEQAVLERIYVADMNGQN